MKVIDNVIHRSFNYLICWLLFNYKFAKFKSLQAIATYLYHVIKYKHTVLYCSLMLYTLVHM